LTGSTASACRETLTLTARGVSAFGVRIPDPQEIRFGSLDQDYHLDHQPRSIGRTGQSSKRWAWTSLDCTAIPRATGVGVSTVRASRNRRRVEGSLYFARGNPAEYETECKCLPVLLGEAWLRRRNSGLTHGRVQMCAGFPAQCANVCRFFPSSVQMCAGFRDTASAHPCWSPRSCRE
jgi:hypothetical protein